MAMPAPARTFRPLFWVSSSRDDLKQFPEEVRDAMGFALYQVQIGDFPSAAKPLKGLGSGVLEIVSDFAGDAYRAVLTVRFRRAVYVLHAFKKKSKRGAKTPRSVIDLVRHRLERAAEDYRRRFTEEPAP